MSLTTLILDFLVVALLLMTIGWVVDQLRSEPAPASPSPQGLDVAHASRRPMVRTGSGLTILARQDLLSCWGEN